MTREDIIEGLNKVENELYLKHGDEDLANQIHNISEALRLNQLSLPPAEGAEEVIRKYCYTWFSCPTGQEEVWSSLESVTIAVHEFATLHAQRLAEKMVEESKKPKGKCEMCGNPDVTSSFYCPNCSWHHNQIP